MHCPDIHMAEVLWNQVRIQHTAGEISKQNIKDIDDYKLSTLAKYFGIENMAAHRALSDCHLTKHVYEKLIEK